VTTLRADSGTPQRGDFFHTSGLLLAPGQTEGPEIGEWQCRAVWTSSQGDMSARHNLYCTFFYELFGRGAIAGITNRGGAEPLSHIGAVVGGTGEFFGASGSWQQEPVRAGVTRQVFDLILPEV